MRIADEVAALGALDDAGGDRPSARERRRVVQVRLFRGEVVAGAADVLARARCRGPGEFAAAWRSMSAMTPREFPRRMSVPQMATCFSAAVLSPAGVKQRAAFHRYSMTWMRSMRMGMVMPRFPASARNMSIWWVLPSARAIHCRLRAGSRRSISAKTQAMTAAQLETIPQVYQRLRACGCRAGSPSRAVHDLLRGPRLPVRGNAVVDDAGLGDPLVPRLLPGAELPGVRLLLPGGLPGRFLAQRVLEHADALAVRGRHPAGRPAPARPGSSGPGPAAPAGPPRTPPRRPRSPPSSPAAAASR